MVLNIVLNLILIPRMQAFGSAYASLATQLFTGGFQLILAFVLFKLKIEIRFIIQLLVFVGVVAVLGTLSKQIDQWFLGYLAMLGASVVFAILLKLFNLKDLYKIRIPNFSKTTQKILIVKHLLMPYQRRVGLACGEVGEEVAVVLRSLLCATTSCWNP